MALLDFYHPDDVETKAIADVDETYRRLGLMLEVREEWSPQVSKLAHARNIRASTGIEGHQVALDDALSAIDGSGAIKASTSVWLGVNAYWNATAFIATQARDPDFEYHPSVLRALHYIMTHHAGRLTAGRYRPSVVGVRESGAGGVAFEDVPQLVRDLVEDLREDAENGHVLIRAAMAHLNLVVVRPFRDGNGLMGRALQTLVLAKEGSLPTEYISVEEHLGQRRDDYYSTLAEIGRTRDPRTWVRLMITAHHHQAITWIDRVRDAERLWGELDAERTRLGLPGRYLPSMFQAANRLEVRRSDHIGLTDVSERVATSDLKAMVDAGLLVAVGDRRGRYYVASPPLTKLARKVTESHPPIPGPFGGD